MHFVLLKVLKSRDSVNFFPKSFQFCFVSITQTLIESPHLSLLSSVQCVLQSFSSLARSNS